MQDRFVARQLMTGVAASTSAYFRSWAAEGVNDCSGGSASITDLIGDIM